MGALLDPFQIIYMHDSDSDFEHDNANHGYETIHRNAEAKATGRTTTTAGSAGTEAEHHASSDKGSNQCPVCDRSFALRKTMLRHVRTVHARRDLMCPSCDRKFVRQDNLSRHIAEQHTSNDHFVKCKSCGRRVAKRGLAEHLQSQICKTSGPAVAVGSTNECEYLYVEDKNDCFLLTMRVLKLWLPLVYKNANHGSGNQSSSYGSASRSFTESDAYYQCCSLGNRALESMKRQMRDKTASQRSLKLFCTAILWGVISLVGVHSGEDVPFGLRDWDGHLKGAAALLKVFHDSSCDCGKCLLCPKLQEKAAEDPALSLLKAIVRDTGLIGILLSVLPSLVQTWEHAIRLIDVLLQCLLNQTDQAGEKIAGCQTLCEANGITSDNERGRGLMALIWTLTKIRSDDRPRSPYR